MFQPPAKVFQNDPFFRNHLSEFMMEDSFPQDPFRHMEQFLRNPFSGLFHGPGPMPIQGPPGASPQFPPGFGSITNMMPRLEPFTSDPNAHVFSQSSVYTYSSDGRGPPKQFQAHTSTRQAPGGIRETRRALRDDQQERMAIGHHIGGRSHVIERSRDLRTGEQDQQQEFVNLEENQAQAFDQEFRQRMERQTGGRAVGTGPVAPAIEYNPQRQ